MPLNFYLHTPLPDEMNERRAVLHVGRQLYKQVGGEKRPFTLIVNINPDQDPTLTNLTQLDALLLAPTFVAILEFKTYFDPIIGRHLTGKWHTKGRKQRQQVHGGAYKNPFLQAKNARQVWQEKLTLPLHHFLLFYPYLHPDSQFPMLKSEHYWFSIQSIDEIKSLLVSTQSPQLSLDEAQQKHIAETMLNGRLWPLTPLLTQISGHLHVLEPNQPLVRYPIYGFDSFTLGRSKRVAHRVRLTAKEVSSSHARLFMDGTTLFVEDLNSKNGMFVAGVKQTAVFPLHPHIKATIGGDAVQIWYVPLEHPSSAQTLTTW